MIVPTEAFAHIAKALNEASDELVKIGACMQSDRFDENEVITSLLRITIAHQIIADVIAAVVEDEPQPQLN